MASLKSGSAPLSAGDISAGQILVAIYDGTNFQTEVKALAGRPYYTPLDLGG